LIIDPMNGPTDAGAIFAIPASWNRDKRRN